MMLLGTGSDRESRFFAIDSSQITWVSVGDKFGLKPSVEVETTADRDSRCTRLKLKFS